MAPHITRRAYERQLRAHPKTAEALDRGWHTIHPCDCEYDGCEGWRLVTDLRRVCADSGIASDNPLLDHIDQMQAMLDRKP